MKEEDDSEEEEDGDMLVIRDEPLSVSIPPMTHSTQLNKSKLTRYLPSAPCLTSLFPVWSDSTTSKHLPQSSI